MKNNKKLNFLFVLESSKIGGPQLRVINYANELKKYHDTKVLASSYYSKDLKNILIKNNIKFDLLPITWITKEKKILLNYIIFFIYEIFLICKYLLSNKIDLVETSSGAYQIKAAIACILTRTKFIIHLNDTYCPFFFRLILLFTNQFSIGISCASQRTHSYYKKYFSKPSVVIQAPINKTFFKIKKKLNNKINIGTLCNISPVKDLDLFIEIANKFQNEKFYKFKFIIFGKVFSNQNKYFNDLQKKIKFLKLKNIVFIINKKKTKFFFENLSYYICSSKNESSPLSVWEALSLGIPVFSTNVGDINKLLKNRSFDFICNTRDEKVFFERIKKFHSLNKNKKILITNKLTKIAKKNFHPKVCCSKHLKFIYKLL